MSVRTTVVSKGTTAAETLKEVRSAIAPIAALIFIDLLLSVSILN
jgi:hypothetical protein